jgi:hypothetical protein
LINYFADGIGYAMINDPADMAMSLGDITGFNTVIWKKAVRQTRRGGFFLSL